VAIKTARPSDFTGTQREAAAAAAADELAKRKDQISTAQRIEAQANETDLFDPSTGKSLGAANSISIDPAKKEVVIQVVEDVEDMTLGAGNNYSFKVGMKYKVPEYVAKHLDRLGLVWGGL
jgi:hypothetical protein